MKKMVQIVHVTGRVGHMLIADHIAYVHECDNWKARYPYASKAKDDMQIHYKRFNRKGREV